MILKNFKIKFLIVGIALACIILLVYAVEIEPNQISVTHTKIKISSGTDNLTCKLLVFADIHAAGEDHEKFLGEVVKEINKISEKEKIDAVIIAGDMIDYNAFEVKFLAPLKNIKNQNIYAVLGNHDYGRGWSDRKTADEVEEYMESAGVDVMRNENRVICDGRVSIGGVDDLWSEQYSLSKTFNENKTAENKTAEKIPEILISHNPDIIYRLEGYEPDLIISGHTHNGQINIPFIGPASMPSKAGETCPSGLCSINNHKIYITRGVGGNPRIRFLSSPEISIIELQ